MVSKNTKTAVTTSFGVSQPRQSKKNAITKAEVKRRAGYIFLGIFVANLIDPFQNWLVSLSINPIAVSIVGLIGVFYFFEF